MNVTLQRFEAKDFK